MSCTGGLFASDAFLGTRREKHYHKDYRKPKDEIRDYRGDVGGCSGGDVGVSSGGCGVSRDVEPFPSDSFDKYRQRYNQYLNRLERTYPEQVREEFCDNRATDSRSYTERRKKTVRFNSEGWDTLEDDMDPNVVDSRWTSAHTVYYDEVSPPGPPQPRGAPTQLHPSAALVRDHQVLLPPRRVGGWTAPGPMRDFPLPGLRKEPWEVERQESQDSQTKDSGIDSGTSSNFNSSEDSSKGEIPRSCRVGIQGTVEGCIVYMSY